MTHMVRPTPAVTSPRPERTTRQTQPPVPAPVSGEPPVPPVPGGGTPVPAQPRAATQAQPSPLTRALRLLACANGLRKAAYAHSDPRRALVLAAAAEALQHAAGGDQEGKREAARDARCWNRRTAR